MGNHKTVAVYCLLLNSYTKEEGVGGAALPTMSVVT